MATITWARKHNLFACRTCPSESGPKIAFKSCARSSLYCDDGSPIVDNTLDLPVAHERRHTRIVMCWICVHEDGPAQPDLGRVGQLPVRWSSLATTGRVGKMSEVGQRGEARRFHCGYKGGLFAW